MCLDYRVDIVSVWIMLGRLQIKFMPEVDARLVLCVCTILIFPITVDALHPPIIAATQETFPLHTTTAKRHTLIYIH